MDLFETQEHPVINILPSQGIANYYGLLMPHEEADYYYSHLLNNINWQHDEAIVLGKTIQTKRKMALYGDKSFEYGYSKTIKTALLWTDELLEIRDLVERKVGERFNSCLLNLYHNGSEGMAWHCDDEKDLMFQGSIASLSLGAERKFSFKHKKTKHTESLLLQHASLLVMKGETQTHWLHSLPTTKKVNSPRINLTFRHMN